MPAVANPGGTDARLRRGERFCRADYRRTFAEGKSFPSRSFVGWALGTTAEGSTTEATKLGVVVSRRTFPLAVERNRAKRLMREAFRLSKGEIAQGAWVLLIGRHHLVEKGVAAAAVAREFRRFLHKANIAAHAEGKQVTPRQEATP